MVRRRPGPAPQTSKREQFARLIARGIPNAEACRLVGVNRRTGTRWRFGREITGSSGQKLHYPAMINTRKREISPRYLSEDERVRIADLDRAGHSVRAIAASWHATRRRSAGSCGATPIRSAGSTGHSPRNGSLRTGGPGQDGASCGTTRCCASS